MGSLTGKAHRKKTFSDYLFKKIDFHLVRDYKKCEISE